MKRSSAASWVTWIEIYSDASDGESFPSVFTSVVQLLILLIWATGNFLAAINEAHTHTQRHTHTHHTSSSMTNFSAPKMVSHCVLNLHLLVMSLFLIWALDYAHSFTVTGVALFLTVWSHALHVSSLSHLCRGV